MIKKALFLGGLLATLFLFYFLTPTTTQAAEGDCPWNFCFVPAPTILLPEDGGVVTTTRPAIRALTWKTTIVKVYLDGRELTNIQQRKHEDYYGSVFVVPDFDLTPGYHYVYTIAHSEKPGWYDRSKESLYINFTVEVPELLPAPAKPITAVQPILPTPPELTPPPEPLKTTPPKPETPPQPQPEAKQPAEQAKITEPEVSIVQPAEPTQEGVEVITIEPEGSVEVQEKGEIEGGVSVEQETLALQEAAGISDLGEILKDEFVAKEQQARERKNRFIGLVMLGIILVVAIIWLTVDRQQRIKREILEEDEGELPPPPQPPQDRFKKKKSIKVNQTQLKKEDEEITVEPIKEEIEEDEYWASPPPSPYSPYPTLGDREELKDKERQDDLGI